MKFIAPVAALLGCSAFAAQSASAVEWPENGVLKLNTANAPSVLDITMEGCINVKVDFGKGLVTAKGTKEDSSIASTTSVHPLVEDGASFVMLMMRQGGSVNAVMNLGAKEGGFAQETLTLPATECRLTKLNVTSSDNAKLRDMHLSVSEEIHQVIN